MEAGETMPDEQATTTCYRHPDRETHIRCSRCDRHICPDCMREAAVGFHCPECVAGGNQEVRQARTAFGARIRQDFVPWVTYSLIAVNVLMYVAELALGDSFVHRFATWGGVNRYTDGFEALAPSGGIANGEWYRLVTGAFLHAQPDGGTGILHILLNMWMLWMLGRVVEQGLGHARYTALYLTSAVGGSVLAYVFAPDTNTVGASGAIFGLIAGYYLMTRRIGRPDTPFLVQALIWLVISAGFASWQGHLGGLLAGGAVAYVFAYTPQQHRRLLHIAGPIAVLVILGVTAGVNTAALI
jgi:membrane associated rhomboid family serine protease